MNRRDFVTGAAALTGAPALASTNALAEIRDLYNVDMTFSDFAVANARKVVEFTGFMAPPLKADSKFFVLTKIPMAICPFCESDAEWPDDILAIYTKRVVQVTQPHVKILVSGVLDLGGYTDPDTGFYSRVRVEDASYFRALL